MIEAGINDLLFQFMENTEHIEKARMSSYQKICLVESLLLKGNTKGTCFEIIEKINALRNDIAHKLEPKDLNAKIINIVCVMFPDNKLELNKTDLIIKYLKTCIGSLVGQLSSLREKHELTKQSKLLQK